MQMIFMQAAVRKSCLDRPWLVPTVMDPPVSAHLNQNKTFTVIILQMRPTIKDRSVQTSTNTTSNRLQSASNPSDLYTGWLWPSDGYWTGAVWKLWSECQCLIRMTETTRPEWSHVVTRVTNREMKAPAHWLEIKVEEVKRSWWH